MKPFSSFLTPVWAFDIIFMEWRGKLKSLVCWMQYLVLSDAAIIFHLSSVSKYPKQIYSESDEMETVLYLISLIILNIVVIIISYLTYQINTRMIFLWCIPEFISPRQNITVYFLEKWMTVMNSIKCRSAVTATVIINALSDFLF